MEDHSIETTGCIDIETTDEIWRRVQAFRNDNLEIQLMIMLSKRALHESRKALDNASLAMGGS